MKSISLLLSLVAAGCAGEASYDPASLDASTREAIAWTDPEAEAAGVPRDPGTLDDERILAEVRGIADFAIEHGCEVVGALGGVWTDGAEGEGGDLHGRWFALDDDPDGDLVGLHTPDAGGPGAGAVEGTWDDGEGRTGTIEGAYSRLEDGDGAFLARYAADDGDASGVLGGLWYRNLPEGGEFFGVWGHCPGGADAIGEDEYVPAGG